MDEHLQPVPVGVPGVLYIGGMGLARGYLNQPALTDEKFISHPFKDDPNARIYNTGDMARYQPDGKIECLGRIDHQVKIRGFRIELGEIESSISEYPNIEQAVVVAREDSPGNKNLAAYIKATDAKIQSRGDEQSISVHELRDFLQKKLPDYMIPSAFVFLDELPLTPNGKIDRKSLPAPNQIAEDHPDDSVAPRSETEAALMSLWSEVINRSSISIHANFFEIGGTSLTAVRLFAQIEQFFGKRLPIATLLEASTVARLAALLDQDGDTAFA